MTGGPVHLVAELAARHDELKPLIALWQAARTEKESRPRDWELAQHLVGLGAVAERGALDAIRAAGSLLARPNPLPPLVAAAAAELRSAANTALPLGSKLGGGRSPAPGRSGVGQDESRHEARAISVYLGLDADTARDFERRSSVLEKGNLQLPRQASQLANSDARILTSLARTGDRPFQA